MRLRWPRLTCAVATIALFALLAACSPHRNEPVVLHFWAMGREGEVVKELLPAFERAHPGIRVDIQQSPWLSAQEKLLTAFAGDVTPDLCQLGNTWVPQFAALGALVPLDARVAASRRIERSDYFDGIWESNRIGSTLYGVPWYVDTRLLFYRKDLLAAAGFAKPPQTWAEWNQMLAALKLRAPDRFGVLLPINEFEPLLVLALQQNEELLRDGGRYGNFRSVEFRRTLTYYLDMFRNKWAPALSNTQISNVWDEFGRGYFSFYISGPWNIGEFKRRLPAGLQQSWTTAPMPGPNGPGASVAGGSSLVVFKASKHQQEAWQLIEYLSQPEVQRRFFELTGNLPPRRSGWDGTALASDVHAAAFRDQLERAKSPPKVPEWQRIATEMRLVTESLVAGEVTVDQAVTELDARADRILEKRRWMLQREGAK
ncbi:MAG: sugar ABC transporter substrate-binding protein [Pseudomonadota bacterium]|nr:sugar ABC transporter substrate-binding protein [Pseudomonadota bacterium]